MFGMRPIGIDTLQNPGYNFLSAAASVISIAAGANSLLGGGGGQSSGQAQQQATAPWWTSGGGADAATQLQQLMQGGPQSIFTDKAFTQANDQALNSTSQHMAAMGQHLSGNESAALNQQSQNDALSFYQQQTGLLSSLAGIGFNPASGVSAGQNQQAINNQQTQQGFSNVIGGIGGLSTIYGSAGTGYANSNPLYSSANAGANAGGSPEQIASLAAEMGITP